MQTQNQNTFNYHNTEHNTETFNQCELCLRQNIAVTKHHLIPQCQHPRILKKLKKNQSFTKEDMLTRVAWLCRPCHSQVHAVLTNRELAYEYNTLNKLKKVTEIQKFATWVANKPNDLKITIRGKKR